MVQVATDPTWAYVTTGAIAVAGIAGTLWQGIRAQKAEAKNLTTTLHADAERAKLAEKRRIYAQCLVALNSQYRAALAAQAHYPLTVTVGQEGINIRPEAAEAIQAHAEASLQAMTAVAELGLIAAPEVAEPAAEALAMLIKPSADLQVDAIAAKLVELPKAMRADFGEAPLPEGVLSPPPA